MTVLMWIAVLVAAWFVASVVVALVMGRYLRSCAAGVDAVGGAVEDDPRRPLDTGPLRLWLADLPDSRQLIRSGPRVPVPRAVAQTGQAQTSHAETTAVR